MVRLTRTKRRILGMLLEVAPGDVTAREIGLATGIKSGSLYPALRTLSDVKLVVRRWDVQEDQPRRMYSLTSAGVELARDLEAEHVTGPAWRAYLPEL